jgi:succinate-acetate transporter protein
LIDAPQKSNIKANSVAVAEADIRGKEPMTDVSTNYRAASTLTIESLPAPADPAPLGLAGFALTTFLLSAFNAGWTKGSGLEFLGYAFAYGGVTQLLAGMWEFRNRNVFGATAFSSYGAFWIGLALYFELGAPSAKTASQLHNDLGWILLSFAIFTLYMTIWSAATNLAVMAVFVVLEVTLVVLFIANFSNSTGATHLGGYLGIATAVLAWYASAAGVINGMRGRTVLFVGNPLVPAASTIDVGR